MCPGLGKGDDLVTANTVCSPQLPGRLKAGSNLPIFGDAIGPMLAGAGAHDVYPAPDGAVWFTAQSAGKLGRLDPRTGKSDLIALGLGAAPHGVIVGPDGAAWVTEGGQNVIARVDPPTHAVKLFPLPKERRAANLNTAAFDHQGVLWFSSDRSQLLRASHECHQNRLVLLFPALARISQTG